MINNLIYEFGWAGNCNLLDIKVLAKLQNFPNHLNMVFKLKIGYGSNYPLFLLKIRL